MNIPYKHELNPMFSFIHYNNHHLKKEAMQKKIISNGFLWLGYTNDFEAYIKSCSKCYCQNNIKKKNIKLL